MKYLIAIFFPFVSFFYIKKPVSGYFCFIIQVLAFLGVSIYPTIMVLFVIWFLLILWAFFEISDFNNKKTVVSLIKRSFSNLGKDFKSSYNDQFPEQGDSHQLNHMDSRNHEYSKYPKQLDEVSSVNSIDDLSLSNAGNYEQNLEIVPYSGNRRNHNNMFENNIPYSNTPLSYSESKQISRRAKRRADTDSSNVLLDRYSNNRAQFQEYLDPRYINRAPAQGYAEPRYDNRAPAQGYAEPRYDNRAPAQGYAEPRYDNRAPAQGYAEPRYDNRAPAQGYAEPRYDNRAPAQGYAEPRYDNRAPAQGYAEPSSSARSRIRSLVDFGSRYLNSNDNQEASGNNLRENLHPVKKLYSARNRQNQNNDLPTEPLQPNFVERTVAAVAPSQKPMFKRVQQSPLDGFSVNQSQHIEEPRQKRRNSNISRLR